MHALPRAEGGLVRVVWITRRELILTKLCHLGSSKVMPARRKVQDAPIKYRRRVYRQSWEQNTIVTLACASRLYQHAWHYRKSETHRNAAWYPSPRSTDIRNIFSFSSPCIFCNSLYCIRSQISLLGIAFSRSHLLQRTATGTPSTIFSPINASNSNPASSSLSESDASKRNNTALHSQT